uniref:Uncharacterized protein n=1 Tax=Anguilla anguilla TaxID=7936 RepID=A0A0E9QGM5_ANGAN
MEYMHLERGWSLRQCGSVENVICGLLSLSFFLLKEHPAENKEE